MTYLYSDTCTCGQQLIINSSPGVSSTARYKPLHILKAIVVNIITCRCGRKYWK